MTIPKAWLILRVEPGMRRGTSQRAVPNGLFNKLASASPDNVGAGDDRGRHEQDKNESRDKRVDCARLYSARAHKKIDNLHVRYRVAEVASPKFAPVLSLLGRFSLGFGVVIEVGAEVNVGAGAKGEDVVKSAMMTAS